MNMKILFQKPSTQRELNPRVFLRRHALSAVLQPLPLVTYFLSCQHFVAWVSTSSRILFRSDSKVKVKKPSSLFFSVNKCRRWQGQEATGRDSGRGWNRHNHKQPPLRSLLLGLPSSVFFVFCTFLSHSVSIMFIFSFALFPVKLFFVVSVFVNWQPRTTLSHCYTTSISSVIFSFISSILSIGSRPEPFSIFVFSCMSSSIHLHISCGSVFDLLLLCLLSSSFISLASFYLHVCH